MTTTHASRSGPPTRFRRPPVAHLLAAVVGLYGLLNVVRALADPVRFAEDFGIPLVDPSETTFVVVYASRTAVLALTVLVLVVLRQSLGLAVLTSLAVLMPVADAVQTAAADASAATVARHASIAVALLVVALLCIREAGRAGGDASPGR